MAERAAFLLAKTHGREEAHRLVAGSGPDLAGLDLPLEVLDPTTYLGAAEAFVDRALARYEEDRRMTDPQHERGMQMRREVLGDEHVDRAVAGTTEFTADFQELITRYAWGEIWSRPGLDRRTRSIVTLVALVALGREHELADARARGAAATA